jgi:hypothetical protein
MGSRTNQTGQRPEGAAKMTASLMIVDRMLTVKDGTVKAGGTRRHLGYLNVVDGVVVDDDLGSLDGVTPTDAWLHNTALDAAIVNGFDGCEVGQGHAFYVRGGNVTTRLGRVMGRAVVLDDTRYKTVYTFTRNGKRFVGDVPADDDAGVFVRID